MEPHGSTRAAGDGERRPLILPVRAIGSRDTQGFAPPSIKDDPRHQANEQTLQGRVGGGQRVVGGRRARTDEFLDCVAVGNDAMWGCTGTLIARRVVVTAGHCADFATRVFIGNDVDSLPARGRVVSVQGRFRHPAYDPVTYENDLMILLLSEDVVNIAPRAFADDALVAAAPDGRVVGFGHHNADGTVGYGVKRLTDVPVVSPDCRGSTGGRTDTSLYQCHTGRELVAGRRDLGKDSCRGDSGGPLYMEDEHGDWWLAGATSRATSKAVKSCGDGGIYVRVALYRSWMVSLPGVDLS
jgi:secreted trypsin-like serine protease